jgi:ketosteroid isomerase-like protein
LSIVASSTRATTAGTRGSGESLGLYQLLFRDGDLRIRVEDQIAEGDRVVSRWVAEGHNRGRPLRLWGITISHIADGEIVEDWSASDNLDVLRQLGPRRLLLLGVIGSVCGATDGRLGGCPDHVDPSA